MPPSTHGTTALPWATAAVPRALAARLPRPCQAGMARHEAEMPARRYLASRGGNPMVARPLRRALAMLLRDVLDETAEGWRVLLVAAAMLVAALVLLASTGRADMPPGAAGVLLLAVQAMVALAAGAWAALVAGQALPRLRRALRLRALLARGDWPAAFRLALRYCGSTPSSRSTRPWLS